MHIEQLLIRYGLLAVLLGAAFEGDFTLILSGVVSHLGYFPFAQAVAAGAIGSFLADCAWYTLGRLRGPRFRAGRLYGRVGPRIERLARRIGAAELIVSRFIYGTKSASMVFWGLHGMPVLRFALIDALGCALGAVVFSGLGYLVSGSAEALLGRVRRVELWLLGALVVGIVLVVVIHLVTKREVHFENGEGQPG